MATPAGRQLAEIDAQFRANQERARAVASRLGEARLTVRPGRNKWSVAECLAHLNLSSEPYFPLWRDALAGARSRQLFAERPFKLDVWGWALAWFLEPPPKLRSRTPPNFQPIDVGPAVRVLPAFLACQERLLAALADADGLAIDRLKITSPFDGRVRYSVWSSFVVSAAHQRRHLWQAERVADVLLK